MLKCLFVLAVAGLSVSCGEKTSPASSNESDMSSGYCSLTKPFKESEFSEWMSKADQQVAYEQRKEGMYFAYTEGRNNGGFHQYRHVTKKFTGAKHSEFAVFWGLSEDEFYQIDLNMRKKGFERSNLQVFEDGTGKAYHQVLWLLPN